MTQGETEHESDSLEEQTVRQRAGELSPMMALCATRWIGCSIPSSASRSAPWIGRSWGGGKWSPAIDVAESDKELTVRAELPGIDPKDLDVTVTGNQLVHQRREEGVERARRKGGLPQRDPLRLVPPHDAVARRDRHGERRRPIRQRRADAPSEEDRAGRHEADRGQGEVDYAGTTFTLPNWRKWLSKAKAVGMDSRSITALLTQSVKLHALSPNCRKVCQAACTSAGVTHSS